MDDSKNKSKRPKSEIVKSVVQSYLQKRNYTYTPIENASVSDHLTYTSVDKELRNPNSILYSCYNSDPTATENTFEKFLAWTKSLIKKDSIFEDLEHLIAPLFCHFYLEILKGGHTDYATQFFRKHLPSIDTNKCDDFITNLINSITSDQDNKFKEDFRRNKYLVNLSEASIDELKLFLEKNHVVLLHIFQTWFDLVELAKPVNIKNDEETMHVEEDDTFVEIDEIIQNLAKEPNNIFVVNLSNVKEQVNCALMKRKCGLVIFNKNNAVVLRPIHSYDPILHFQDAGEIKIAAHTNKINSISITSDFTKLATGSSDCNCNIYDLSSMTLDVTCTGHLGPVYCTAISSNNVYLASASQDTTARLWNMETGNCLRIFIGHIQEVTCLDFHPNCLYLATGSGDKNLRLWCIDDGSPARLFVGSKGVIYSVAFNPKGQTIASASDDKKIRIWDVLSSKILAELKHKGEPITKLEWSECGKQLCAGALDGIVRVWELGTIPENGEKNYEPFISTATNSPIYDLEYEFGYFACVTADEVEDHPTEDYDLDDLI